MYGVFKQCSAQMGADKRDQGLQVKAARNGKKCSKATVSNVFIRVEYRT